MDIKQYDLVVIGGGPGGYVAAIRAAQLGMRTVVIEKEKLGGTCLNVGCIPTKTLFQSAEIVQDIRNAAKYGIHAELRDVDFAAVMKRKDQVVAQLVSGVTYLMKKNKIDVIKGEVYFQKAKQVVDVETGTAYEGKYILICTGTENSVPPVAGINGVNIGDSTQLLSMTSLPKSVVIMGGGVIGCELAHILHSFGSEVTVIEMLDKLINNMDSSCSEQVKKQFLADGIHAMTGTRVIGIADTQEGRKNISCESNGTVKSITADYVLVATGRKPGTASLKLKEAGIYTEKGFIQVNDYMETSVPGVYAAGDVTGKTALAHAASEGGVVAVEHMVGGVRKADFRNVPKVIFIQPEIASAGMTEQEAKSAGYDVITGMFDLSGNGKSVAMGKNNGFVKVVAEKENHQILGFHMAGSSASEMVTLFTSLLEMEAVLEEVEYTTYPHPAVSEAVKEACLDALGIALNK